MTDDSEEKLMSQALPVAEVNKNISLNNPPATGEEYLYRVRLEASNADNFVVANINTKKYESKRTPQYITYNEQTNSTDETLKMSIEWQVSQAKEFSQLVERAKKEKDQFLKNNNLEKSFNFPKKRSEWRTFCFGKLSKKSSAESAHKPLLSLMYKMNQVTIVQLLEYQVEWFEEYGYSNEAFEWIYALMVFLEKPLLPDSCSALRSLSRKCIELRSKLKNSENEQFIPFNLIITIIGRYFEQFDLIDKND